MYFPFLSFRDFFRILMQRDYLVDPAALRLLIEKHLTYQRLEDAAIPCHVVATDIIGGGEVRLSIGLAVDALLASTAIPTIFPPVRIGGQFLVDGGIANNTPISTAADLGATRMIVLPTGFACAIDRPPRGAIAIALHAMNLIVARQLVHDMERLACAAELVAVPPLCPLTVSPYDLSQSAELIDRAAEETRRWIGEGGLERGGVPASLCPHSHRAMMK